MCVYYVKMARIQWTRVNVMVRDFRPEDGIIDMVCVNYDITELKETKTEVDSGKR